MTYLTIQNQILTTNQGIDITSAFVIIKGSWNPLSNVPVLVQGLAFVSAEKFTQKASQLIINNLDLHTSFTPTVVDIQAEAYTILKDKILADNPEWNEADVTIVTV